MAIAVLLAGCYQGPGPSHFVSVADELQVPVGWALAKSIVRGPNETEKCEPFSAIDCPAAVRSYLVTGEVLDAYREAKETVARAGFAVAQEFRPDCDAAPSAPPCGFVATRGDDQVHVNVYRSGGDAGLSTAPPNTAAVVISIERRP